MENDRSFAVVHLDHILHNYRLLQKQAKDSQVMAVVKADAYGHGSVEVARMLEDNGCHYFAVACLKEAIELRQAGIKGEILIFGRTSPENAVLLNQHNLIQTIYSLDYASQLNDVGVSQRVHINIDTGMSRFGFYLHGENDLNKVVTEIQTIDDLPHMIVEGIYTHFANSDETDSSFCKRQFQLFDLLLKELDDLNIFLIRHAANSAATMAYPYTHLDMVRVGIAMYGYPPVQTDLDFLPGMEVFARLSSVRTVTEQDTVSYGRTYTPDKEKKIATVNIGYADGYNRLLSNRDFLMHGDKKLPVIGRVCMDAIMIDIDNEDLKDGDLVEVFGLHKDMNLMCKTLNTIPYEILCNVSKRVPRIYVVKNQ